MFLKLKGDAQQCICMVFSSVWNRQVVQMKLMNHKWRRDEENRGNFNAWGLLHESSWASLLFTFFLDGVLACSPDYQSLSWGKTGAQFRH